MLRRLLRAGAWILLLPLFVIVAALDTALDARSATARLASDGVDAQATITEKYERTRFVPGVRSKYVEPEHVLRFSYSSGSVLRGDFHVGTGEERVTQAFFERIEPGATAPLRYLREDDDVFELEPGRYDREQNNALAIAALIGALSIPLVVIVVRRAARPAAALSNINQPGTTP